MPKMMSQFIKSVNSVKAQKSRYLKKKTCTSNKRAILWQKVFF